MAAMLDVPEAPHTQSTRKAELFGGAVTATLPGPWVDMAALGQPPPDNQEVFCAPRQPNSRGESIIFEVVERAAVGDGAAAAFFFEDVAETGGAAERTLLATGSVPPLRSGAASVQIALGTMLLSKTGVVGAPHAVDVGVAAFRFPEEATDFVVTVNVPALSGSRLPAENAAVAHLLASGAAGMAVLRDVVASLVVDRSLFASS